MSHPISFEGHVGKLFISSGGVEFYNTIFDNMCDASRLLSRLPVGIKYNPFYYGDLQGLQLVTGGVMVLLSDKTTRWFLSETDVHQFYLKTRGINII